ncbi:MAG: hypothetical protein QXW91_00835 [Candidatus Nitrosotenuis sp.]
MSSGQSDLVEILSGIQKRLDVFEMQLRLLEERFPSDKKLWEDNQKVADIGSLGGKEITEENGIKKKTTMLRTCDCCGDVLENQFVVCTVDRRKVCPSCTVSLEGQKICRDCMRLTRPLSKPSYKILYLISSQIDNNKKVHDLAKVPNNEINDSKRFLFESGYILRKGLTGFKISERGANMLTAYRQIYGNDEDVKTLESEVKKQLGI